MEPKLKLQVFDKISNFSRNSWYFSYSSFVKLSLLYVILLIANLSLAVLSHTEAQNFAVALWLLTLVLPWVYDLIVEQVLTEYLLLFIFSIIGTISNIWLCYVIIYSPRNLGLLLFTLSLSGIMFVVIFMISLMEMK